jgi:NADPH:quinone reductase-like Zn-dependent oxidoreductase
LAIQISRILGASRIVVTARSEVARAELLALGADAFICLAQGREQVVAEVSREAVEGVDVVLDYLWGPPAEWVLEGVASAAKRARPRRVRFVNVGALAGPSMTLAPSTLRSAPIELLGSGLGSLPTSTLVDAVADIVAALESESLHIRAIGLSIDGVSEYWTTDTRSRLVFTF